MNWRTRIKGGTLATVGFMLSPLSWWNDLFVNVPLALGFAWLVSWPWPRLFAAAFVAGYWLTNVLGLVLLQKGLQQAATGAPKPYTRRQLLVDLGIAGVYTLLILLLVKSGLLQPIPNYLHAP